MKLIKVLIVLLIIAVSSVQSATRKAMKKKERPPVVGKCRDFCNELCGSVYPIGNYENVMGKPGKIPKCLCKQMTSQGVVEVKWKIQVKVIEDPTTGFMMCEKSPQNNY